MLQAKIHSAANRRIEAPTFARLPASRDPAAALAEQAVKALMAEACLTPKPALVDGRGSGAHQDLNLDKLLRSARSLHPGFLAMARTAAARDVSTTLREQLARIGRTAETSMLQATGGANAHRGAIWVLGLLVASTAMKPGEAEPAAIAARAGQIAQLPDRHASLLALDSHGARACRRYGVPGARGEAAAGFPHVIHVGLPTLRASRLRGADKTCARLDALMAIMSSLEDTCLLHRGGRAALLAAQRGAQAVLDAGGASCRAGWRELSELDARLTAMNASPGGCADLLAACIFLDG